MLTVWLVLLFICLVGGQVFAKLSSNGVAETGGLGYAQFLLITSFVSCVVFFITGGFRIACNGLTLLFGLAYALIVVVSAVFMLKAYQLAAISNANVVRSACTLVVTAAMGWILFHEEITGLVLLRIGFMLVAIVLIFRDMKAEETKEDKEKKGKILPFIITNGALVLSGAMSVVLLKAFTNAGDRVTDDTSFFFLTNVFLVVGAALWILDWKWKQGIKGEKSHLNISSMKGLKASIILFFIGNTVSSNIAALLEIRLVSLLDVAVFTPINTALGIVAGMVASLAFREKIGVCSVFALLISVIAVVI